MEDLVETGSLEAFDQQLASGCPSPTGKGDGGADLAKVKSKMKKVKIASTKEKSKQNRFKVQNLDGYMCECIRGKRVINVFREEEER